LRPEHSISRSAGFVLTPRVLPGLRWSLDWTKIDKSDNIVPLTPLTQSLLDKEALFPARFIRAAPAAGDPFGVGKITRFDLTSINLARARVEAWDAALDYAFATDGFGKFDWFSTASYITHYETKTFPTDPFVDTVGNGASVVGVTSGSPLRLRASGGLTWSRGALSLGWQSQYYHHYAITVNSTNPTVQMQGNGGRIPSQTYHDAFATYSFDSAAGWLENTDVRLGIQNVFNKRPPVDVSLTNTLYSPFGDPRLASYSLSLRHRF
jgi:outer membrane receptor protein involved in Fe transport